MMAKEIGVIAECTDVQLDQAKRGWWAKKCMAALAGCTALLHMFAPRLGIYLAALHRAESCRIAAAVDARPAVGGYSGGVL